MNFRTNIFKTISLMCILLLEVSGLFKMNKVLCTAHDPDWFNVTVCRLRAVKRNVAEFTFRTTLKEPVKSCNVHIELLRKYTIYRPFFINLTIDACEFMKDRKLYPIPSMIYNSFGIYSNLNHTCPYKGEVVIEKYRPEYDTGFMPLPTAEYLLQVDWIVQRKPRLSTKFWFIYEELQKDKN